MSPDFTFRMIGMVLFAILGAEFGANSASNLALKPETASFLFGMLGILFGLILTPWISLRPLRVLRRSLAAWSDKRLWMSILGLFIALSLALLFSYPLSLLDLPFSSYLPAGIVLVSGYLGISIFGSRSPNIPETLGFGGSGQVNLAMGASFREIILDTSVLIDGRITDIAATGVLGGNLIVPQFVLRELQRVAASPELVIRKRGERGLDILNQLQRDAFDSMKIVDEDFDEIRAVDDKLVALAQQRKAAIITNDFNLNQVAEAQGVAVLNIHLLANAVRLVYLSGERFEIRIIHEGHVRNQGLGYLEDGTLVIVENGKGYMNRTITVEVTKTISKDTGQIIFAVPVVEAKQGV
jgi:uncharacterized protein YacL